MNITIGLDAFLFVFARTTGMLAFNPVFSRRNVPSAARAALILCISMLLAPVAGVGFLAPTDSLTMALELIGEVFVGAVCGVVFMIFYYLLLTAGDMMDMQFGLSMARVFDPGTSVQASVSGNFLNLLFLLYFFVTDGHLVLLRLFAASYQAVPLGEVQVLGGISAFMIALFSSVFSLALRMALPFIAAELVLEFSMGILMKLIPQIHVFVINFQFKILLGIFMLFAFSQPIGDFLDSYLEAVLRSINSAIGLLAG